MKIINKLLSKIPLRALWLYLLTFLSGVYVTDWMHHGLQLPRFFLDVAIVCCTIDQWCENVWRSREFTIKFVLSEKKGNSDE